MTMKISTVLLAGALGLLGAQGASAQAPGAYRLSCTDIDQRGPLLVATCRGRQGRTIRSQLDVGRCRGDIGNVNGVLNCGGQNGQILGNGEERDGGYGRPSRRSRDDYDYDDRGPRRGEGRDYDDRPMRRYDRPY